MSTGAGNAQNGGFVTVASFGVVMQKLEEISHSLADMKTQIALLNERHKQADETKAKVSQIEITVSAHTLKLSAMEVSFRMVEKVVYTLVAGASVAFGAFVWAKLGLG